MDADPKDRHVGYFIQIVEKNTFIGGLLVITIEGDPVVFVHTEPIVLNSFLMALLDKRAEAYMIAKVLAESLINKAQEKPGMVLFEDTQLLQRSLRLPAIPVVLAPAESRHKSSCWKGLQLEGVGGEPIHFWTPGPSAEKAKTNLEQLQQGMEPFDLREPFQQARKALVEIRKEPVRR